MHHQQTCQTTGEEHHRGEEQDARIKGPKLGRQAQNGLQQGKGDGPDDRAKEEPDAAKEGHQQDDP